MVVSHPPAMEMGGKCAACGEKRMVLDAIHGVLACDECGVVGNQAETELRSEFQTGHVIERRGTYVGETDNGVAAAKGLMRGQISSRSFFTGYSCWTERHRMETMKKVESITALLRVPADKVDQAKRLLESTLDGDWGLGRWVDILVAACVYIVIRQSQLPLTVFEVADCVNCDVVELGRMYNRVLVQLEISLPNVDGSVFLERAASTLPAFQKLNKDLVRKMKSQAKVLLDYAQECFITTGRRPLPVVAAVLSLVVEANQVIVGAADVASELHAGISATKKRYKEFQAALIGLGQSLPWGRDITLKTLPRHLPFLLNYLELKLNLEKKKKRTCPEGKQPSLGLETSPDGQQLSTVPKASVSFGAADPVSSRTSDIRNSLADKQPHSSKRSFDSAFSDPRARATLAGCRDRFISICSKEDQQSQTATDTSSAPLLFERSEKLLKITEVSCSGGSENAHCRSGGSSSIEVNLSSIDNGHEREGDISGVAQPELLAQDSLPQLHPQLSSEQVLDQRKWEGLPAAFCASQGDRTRRRAKIDLAKDRIFQARNTLSKSFGEAPVDSSVPVHGVQQQPKPSFELSKESNMGLDWEDLVIEYFLLRGASEAPLEDGYYQSLQAIYPERQDTERVADDTTPYLRSRSEVELLLEITGRQNGSVITQCPPPLASYSPQ